jgi:quercetin dioxygenase-like cupin family protein
MNAPVRRIITGHDRNGHAQIRSDQEIAVPIVVPEIAAMATVWTTASVPADLNDESDGAARDAGLTLMGGSVLRVLDLLPLGRSPMHRTLSIDYGIVLSGEVELELDDGLVVRVAAGDIVVQQGTIHLWRNPSSVDTCRIIFVLIEAKPYIHEGKPLPELQP